MSNQKMKITDEQFSDFTGTMFNTPFTNSVSDAPMTEKKQNRLSACFSSEPYQEAPLVIHVSSVAVAPSTASVLVGATVQLGGSIKPDNATDRTYKWVSSDPSIATVDTSGLVTGVSVGTVNISLVANDGAITGVSTITVAQQQMPAN